MEHKVFPTASTKVIDEIKGIVEHVITVFGVLDLVEDMSHPGSWTKTLAERGDKLLVLDMHNTDSINRAIGRPVSVREVGRNELPPEVLADYPEATGGVVAQTQLLMDTPEGEGAYIRLRDNAVREWSYGYDALDTDRSVVKNKDGEDVSVRNLRTVKVYEYGPVLWGACPGTMVTGVKEVPGDDGKPGEQGLAEAKPAPDVTENTIRIRVRDPGDFQEDSFRTITIGDEADGIQAVIGRLEGETTTTVQVFIFDKEKFTTAEAQAWVDEHEKQATPTVYSCECIECGHEVESEDHCRDIKCPECGGEMRRAERPGVGAKEDTMGLPLPVDGEEKDVTEVIESSADEEESEPEDKEIVDGKPTQRLGDVLQGSIHRVFTLLTDSWYVDGYLDREQRIQLSSLIGDALGVLAQGIPEEIANLETWGHAVMGLRIEDETKAVDLTQYVADVRVAFETQYNPSNDPWRYWVMAVYDEYVIVQDNEGDGVGFYQVGYTKMEDGITFTPQGEWIGGDYVFVPHGTEDETKAGRVLASRNETRIIGALLTLIEVLDDAGIELPGFEKNPVMEPPEEDGKATAAPVGQAADGDSEAGPTDVSPTLTELVRREEVKNLADWLEEQVESLVKLSKEE